ncbi:MAG: hypothetical protein Q9200_001916 [Gallowayella weberi]
METNTSRSRKSSPLKNDKKTHEVATFPAKSISSQDQNGTLLSYHELQPWQQDNRFIHTHYRPASFSYSRSWKSIAKLHNQSINIWTHLIGALFFALCACWFHSQLAQRYNSASQTDIFVFDVFFLGSILCLGFSAAFHTLSNHSAEVEKSWLLFDMIGILCLTTSSFFPGVFYGFYCEPDVVRTYWSMIVFLGAVCTALLTVPGFQTVKWKHFRTAMFLAVGLSGVLPMSHAVRLFGVAQANLQMGWSWFVWEAVFYISGAMIYANTGAYLAGEI